MKENFIFKQWFLTLTLAPFIPSIYKLLGGNISGEVIELTEIYLVVFIMSFFFSIPTLAACISYFRFLKRNKVKPILSKVILIMTSVLGIILSFLLIGGSISDLLIICYSISAFFSGLIFKIK